MKNNEIVKELEQEKIIVIIRGADKEKLIPLVDALCEGGIGFAEVTFSADGSVSDEQTAAEIKSLADKFKGKMRIGAGTVLTKRQVKLAKAAGAEFIVSPDVNPEVIKATKKAGMVSIPGALTPTEVRMAARFGADFVKLFPVTAFGPDYLKTLSAPLSDVKFLAVGGISLEDIPTYLSAGATGFGIGGAIAPKKLLNADDFDGITEIAKRFTNAAKGVN